MSTDQQIGFRKNFLEIVEGFFNEKEDEPMEEEAPSASQSEVVS
jgi:hypothetical protein